MRPIIKLIQYILSRKVQLNSWQALMKPWDGFCGPLEVRTHPLPPPDSGASFSSFGVFVFDLGCFVFEFWVLRFRDLGASFFGLRFRVLRFRNYLCARGRQLLKALECQSGPSKNGAYSLLQ